MYKQYDRVVAPYRARGCGSADKVTLHSGHLGLDNIRTTTSSHFHFTQTVTLFRRSNPNIPVNVMPMFILLL